MVKAIVALVIVAALAGGAYIVTKNDETEKAATSSNTGNTSHVMTDEDQANSASSAAPKAANMVEISNFAFSPQDITVKKGTTVTWTNKDSTAHNVKETDGKDGPASKLLQTGESYSFTYNSTGTFKYFCSVHPSMTGSVTVTE